MKQVSLCRLALSITLAAALLLSSASCRPRNLMQEPSQPDATDTACCISVPLCRGDLIFFGTPSTPAEEGMEHAITSATGSYTHIAIVVTPDSVVDATPRHGVSQRSIKQLCREMDGATAICYRITTADWDASALLSRLTPLIGKGYDLYFLPDNDLYYCSELVQQCYLDKQGRPLFPSAPMNFLAPDSTLPAYWQHLFDSLQVPIPQNIPGTNPSAMASSPFLERL